MAKDVKEAKAPTAKQEARKALVEKVSEAYPDHALKKCNLGCLHAVAA
jgi:hypothetical protein